MADKINLKISIDLNDTTIAGIDKELAKSGHDPVKSRILEAARWKLQTTKDSPDGGTHIDVPHIDLPHTDAHVRGR